MHVGRKTQKREKSAMSVSLYGNLLFVVIELIMAIVTSSQAVLLDAVYDGVEFVMLLPSLFLIPFLYRPANEQHPFGSKKAQAIPKETTLSMRQPCISILIRGDCIVLFFM